MQNYSVKINDQLFLTRLAVSKIKETKKIIEVPTNHCIIIDCSGSMANDLPKIREQLKLKLPKLLGEKDTISIIWFSGKGEFGTLIKGEFVSTLKDLSDIYKAIDRWLRPNCLTGFKEPLEEAVRIVEDVKAKNPGVFSLFFMSDGYDNCSSQADILMAMEKAAGKYASVTLVEYGYYCNRQLMAKMAEKAGAALIFSESFDKYEPTFESNLGKKVSGAPRVELTLHDVPVNGFAYAIHDNQLVTYSVDDGKVLVPEDYECIWYLSSNTYGPEVAKNLSDACASIKHADGVFHLNDLEKHPEICSAYAAMSLYTQRMNSSIVYDLLRATGDVKLINKFSTAFGKQLMSDFSDLTSTIAISGAGIFQEGRDPNKVPKDDAFTVLDLLQILAEDEGNHILFEHESFKYSRIGRGRIDSSDVLNDDERQEIADLTEKINQTKVASQAKVHQARINEIIDSKKEALKFIADPAPDGYSISGITTNEERPNISIRVQKPGTVNLVSRLPKEGIDVPAQFKTHIFRNYAIVADGLVNIENLPCKITPATLKKLHKSDIPEEAANFEFADKNSAIVIFNLRQIPVINRAMIKAVSAKSLFEQEFKLTALRAEQKVYNTYVKEKLPTRGFVGVAGTYGDAAAAWLKEQGITDNGFNPKVVQAEAKDFYMGKKLEVKIKGYSTIPSVKELVAMSAKNKINPPGALMVQAYNDIEAFLASDSLKVAKDKEGVMKVWFEGQAKATTKEVRKILFEKSKQVFSIIVGQTWPFEFASLDENTLKFKDSSGVEQDGTLKMDEFKINI
jgi:hypothetical protein